VKKKTRPAKRESDQGSMDDLATQRVMRVTKREVDGVTAPGHPSSRNAVRMMRFAGRLEQALERSNSLPSRRSDHSLIGDLAELDLRVARLQRALRAVVATPRAKADREPFENRLVQLASEVDAVRAVLRDLKGPMDRLLKQRCGNVGLAVAAMLGATGTLE
jgi:hypothetical protein